MRIQTLLLSATLVLSAAACGGGKEGETATQGAPQTPSPSASVPATGRTIEVKMITDDKGNYYDPDTIQARKGDVLRFTIVSGVHNVNFTPERNPGVSGLPPASELLQLPGQTHDFTVPFEPGTYGFQCDPHALLGMVGVLEVQS